MKNKRCKNCKCSLKDKTVYAEKTWLWWVYWCVKCYKDRSDKEPKQPILV